MFRGSRAEAVRAERPLRHPTLELGIDIGDLSNVVMCSVPPAPKNYLQRTGRAGRQDGNALTVTVATGQPHDLFFYAEPLDMLASRVNEGLVPLSVAIAGKGDDTARELAQTEERSLVYVAATRAKKELLVLSYGVSSPFFSEA